MTMNNHKFVERKGEFSRCQQQLIYYYNKGNANRVGNSGAMFATMDCDGAQETNVIYAIGGIVLDGDNGNNTNVSITGNTSGTNDDDTTSTKKDCNGPQDSLAAKPNVQEKTGVTAAVRNGTDKAFHGNDINVGIVENSGGSNDDDAMST